MQEESKVKQLTALVKAFVSLSNALKGSFLPVLFSVVATQGGAAFFMQGHVDAALKTEVLPTRAKTDLLEEHSAKAYELLADVVNRRGRIIHAKAEKMDVEKLRQQLYKQRRDLSDALMLVEALQTVVSRKHGAITLQRVYESAKPLDELRQEPEKDLPVPMLPATFDTFLYNGMEGKKDGI